MNPGSTKPEWDTPPHGDFAGYVERLTASNAARSAASPAPPNAANPGRTVPGASGVKGQALPPDLAQLWVPWMGGLRIARTLLLLFVGLHGAALVFWGRGSFAGLIFMGVLWWALGWLLDAAPKILQMPGVVARAGTQSQQVRLRPAGTQRNTGREKK